MTYQPGDVLLYSRTDLYSWIIRMKTWSVVSHCEIVETPASVGFPMFTVASRERQGVERYTFDPDGLLYVMRPVAPFDSGAAYRWFRSVRGQKYDWLGLLAFASTAWQGKENGRMFCSEFCTRYMRAGGVDPFNGYDADGIAPSEFLKSPAFLRLEPRSAAI